jgi:hypothetical protein
MLSDLEFRVVFEGTSQASRIGILPAEWDGERQILKSTKSKWKKSVSPVLLWIHLSYLFFVVNRMSAQLRSGVVLEQCLIHLLFISIHTMGSLYHLHVVLYAKEIIDLFNLLGNFTATQGKMLSRQFFIML